MPQPGNVRYTTHGAQRRLFHGYSREDVRAALREGQVVESYSDTGRGKSYLLLHWTGGRPIHVVAADKPASQDAPARTLIITVYDPRTEPEEWTDDFAQRKR